MTVKATTCSPIYRPTPVPIGQRAYHLFAGVNREQALNCTTETRTAQNDLGFELKQAINAIKLDAFNMDTGRVDYKRLQGSIAYENYRKTTQRLQTFPLRSLTDLDERLAFWINLYNVLIVDAVIHYGITKSVHDVRGFFVKAAYIVDGYRFSADDIEHGVLRANAGNPAIPGPQFAFSDPRHQFMMPELDPRIHFTLVCASESCPPIGVYSAERLNEQLEQAAHNFINGGEVKIDLVRREVTLAKIFQWYAPDFGGTLLNQLGQGSFAPVLRFVARYMMDPDAKAALETEPKSFKVSFAPYNWGLNLLT